MGVQRDDFSCLDLAFYLNNCAAHYPVSDDYEAHYPQEKDRWWEDRDGLIGGQKIHLITYLGACWKLKGNLQDSVYHVWSDNGFKCAAGLIWLLEALDAPQDIIEAAYQAGKQVAKCGGKQPEQSRAIKDVVSWEKIAALCARKNIRKPMR